jgi:transmembrane sensor
MNNETENIAPIEYLTKYFAREASEEEIRQVEKWRDESIENLTEFNAIKKLWDITDIPSGKEPIDIDLEWKKIRPIVSPTVIRKLTARRYMAIAASVMLLAILTFLGISEVNTTVYKTEIAQVKEFHLPDGSIINLNANSKISYRKGFGNAHRNIKLTGEAFFNVSSNKELPFIISTNGSTIEVVGTQFNVKAYKDQENVKVTVSEGVVKISDMKEPQKHILVHAGETGKFDRENRKIEKTEAININDVAWKTRIIHFDNTSMDEVARVLSNTYHINIEVSAPIKPCTITVSFNNKNITDILNVIKSTIDLNIKIINDKIIISGPGCSSP